MANTTYFRTAYGTHRHATYYCANAKRAIQSGDPIAIPANEISNWAPCSDCCTAADVKAAADSAAPVKVMCDNSGMVPANPRKLYRKCSDCGYEGKVGSNGLRAHQPKK